MKLFLLIFALIATNVLAKDTITKENKIPVCLTESPNFLTPSFITPRMTRRSLSGLQPKQKIVIDVLFSYDNRAISYMKKNAFTRDAFALEAMSALNKAMKNSLLNIEFNLVHQMNIDHSIKDGRENISASLDAMTGNTGKFVAVNTARNKYGADLVLYFIDGKFDYAAGKAATLWDKRGNDRSAFAVVTMANALNSHSLVHEVGHLFGAYHDTVTGDGPHPRFGQYVAGWLYNRTDNPQAGQFATVMAYASSGGLRLPVFSSPDVRYPDTQITGDTVKGDNRRIIIETAELVSLYRTRNATPFTPHYTTLNLALESHLTFRTGGDSKWFGQTFATADGVDAAQSGHVGFGQNSWLETTVIGPGILSFNWKTSTDSYSSKLHFSFDGKERNDVSFYSKTEPMRAFEKKQITIPDGTHTVRWTHTRHKHWYPKQLNAVWLDNIHFSTNLFEDSFE